MSSIQPNGPSRASAANRQSTYVGTTAQPTRWLDVVLNRESAAGQQRSTQGADVQQRAVQPSAAEQRALQQPQVSQFAPQPRPTSSVLFRAPAGAPAPQAAHAGVAPQPITLPLVVTHWGAFATTEENARFITAEHPDPTHAHTLHDVNVPNGPIPCAVLLSLHGLRTVARTGLQNQMTRLHAVVPVLGPVQCEALALQAVFAEPAVWARMQDTGRRVNVALSNGDVMRVTLAEFRQIVRNRN